MTELFKYILIALACPLALLMVEPQAEKEQEDGNDDNKV